MFNNFFHKMASPRYFYNVSPGSADPVACCRLCAALFLAGLYYGLVKAPPDYQQGDSYRIMFIHVPAAWMSMFIYVVMAGAGAIGLIWRIKLAEVMAISSATDRGLVYVPGTGHRLHLGQADVGHLVGLGCAPDLGTDPAVSVPGRDRTVQRHR